MLMFKITLMLLTAIYSIVARSLTSYCDGLRLVIPAGLNSQQRFSDFDRQPSVVCFDDAKNALVASLQVKRDSPTSICLEYRGMEQYRNTLPLPELVAKLCMASTSITNIHAIDQETRQPISLDFSKLDSNDSDEIIDWVSTEKDVLLPLPRRVVYKHLLLHRGFGAILIHSKTNRIFVHKRSSLKRVFPSMLDMFIGGVSQHKEPVLTTLVRELSEEVGVDLTLTTAENTTGNPQQLPCNDVTMAADSSSVVYIGTQTIQTQMNHAVVDCFLVFLSEEQASQIQFKDGEIEAGEWITMRQLLQKLEGDGEKLFVPDGMQVWKELPSMLAKASRLSKQAIDNVFNINP